MESGRTVRQKSTCRSSKTPSRSSAEADPVAARKVSASPRLVPPAQQSQPERLDRAGERRPQDRDLRLDGGLLKVRDQVERLPEGAPSGSPSWRSRGPRRRLPERGARCRERGGARAPSGPKPARRTRRRSRGARRGRAESGREREESLPAAGSWTGRTLSGCRRAPGPCADRATPAPGRPGSAGRTASPGPGRRSRAGCRRGSSPRPRAGRRTGAAGGPACTRGRAERARCPPKSQRSASPVPACRSRSGASSSPWKAASRPWGARAWPPPPSPPAWRSPEARSPAGRRERRRGGPAGPGGRVRSCSRHLSGDGRFSRKLGVSASTNVTGEGTNRESPGPSLPFPRISLLRRPAGAGRPSGLGDAPPRETGWRSG